MHTTSSLKKSVLFSCLTDIRLEQHPVQLSAAGLLIFSMIARVHFGGLSLLFQDFSYDDTKVEFNVDAPNGVVMEGYLFKRASNAFKTWNR